MARCTIIDRFDFRWEGQELALDLKFPPVSADEARTVQKILTTAFPGAIFRLLEISLGGVGFTFETNMTFRVSGTSRDTLVRMVGLLYSHLTIFDSLDETHALAPHQIPTGIEDFVRSEIGDLVYRAKSYSAASGSKSRADLLADHMTKFLRSHPRYSAANHFTAVPPSNPSKTFDLPTHLAKHASRTLGRSLLTIGKVRATEPQKGKGTEEDCRTNVTGSMRVDQSLNGATVVVVDDIYRSGCSMAEAARACRQAGAREVLGFAATKTLKFLQGLDVSEYEDRWIAKPVS